MRALHVWFRLRSRTIAILTALVILSSIFVSVYAQNDGPSPTESSQVDTEGSRGGALAADTDSPQQETLRRLREEWIKVEFEDSTLEEVLATLSNQTGVPFDLDRVALDSSGIDSASPVTKKFNHVRIETALERILAELSLMFIVRDGIVVITTVEEAANHPMVQCYPVRALIDPDREVESAQSLMHVITSTISPSEWVQNGGGGTITYYRGILLVGQTYPVLRETERVLDKLQQQVAGQGTPLRASYVAQPESGRGFGGGGFF